jgi:hypothetical protein
VALATRRTGVGGKRRRTQGRASRALCNNRFRREHPVDPPARSHADADRPRKWTPRLRRDRCAASARHRVTGVGAALSGQRAVENESVAPARSGSPKAKRDFLVHPTPLEMREIAVNGLPLPRYALRDLKFLKSSAYARIP